MVIREWRGRAALSKADAYPEHFRETVLPELRGLSGFAGAYLSRRPIDGGMEFLVLTFWRSADSIRAFAGDEIGKAIVEPAAVAALTDFDATVRHYDVVEDAGPSAV